MPKPTQQEQIDTLAWLHAELSWKYAQLVAELRAGLAQLISGRTGAAATTTAHQQVFRQRAARIANIRANQAAANIGQLGG